MFSDAIDAVVAGESGPNGEILIHKPHYNYIHGEEGRVTEFNFLLLDLHVPANWLELNLHSCHFS